MSRVSFTGYLYSIKEIAVNWLTAAFFLADAVTLFIPGWKIPLGYILGIGLVVSAVSVVTKKNNQLSSQVVSFLIERRRVANNENRFVLLRNDGNVTLSDMVVTASYADTSGKQINQRLSQFFSTELDPARTPSFSTGVLAAKKELLVSIPTVTNQVIVKVVGKDLSGKEISVEKQLA